tara:strand:- start:76 stop:336 length:261 start_codon:yes stop_codon:yes gene_type:complete
MKDWIKIFNHPLFGQISVSKSHNEDGDPALKVDFMSNHNEGKLASVSLVLETDEEVTTAFAEIPEEIVFSMVQDTVDRLNKLLGRG